MIRNTIYFTLTLLLSFTILSCNKNDKDENPDDNIPTPEGYSLVWSDEFNGTTINMANWQYETGDGTDYGLPAGWGNNELQLYTESSDNSGIEEDNNLSTLFIRATSDGNDNYTSAKLTSKDLFSIHYGRVEVKAKMPLGQGIWSAIWMLGDNINQIDWPGCGEIDIAEVLGHESNKMYSTLHFTDADNKHGEIQASHSLNNENFNGKYHVFSMNWTPEKMIFMVDEIVIQEVSIEDDMKEFLRSFYLVLNVAVGGNWPGYPDNTTVFPQTMNIDYIRVFEKNDFTPPEPPVLDIDEESIGQNIEPTIAQHAINDGFSDLGNATVIVYGGGGEPVVSVSETAIDGDSSVVFNYPGGSWGGGYIELVTPVDLSQYTHLKFSLVIPSSVANAEIKLESPSTNASIFIADFQGTDVGNGFLEYNIPLSDFAGLDLTQIKIPFSVWNPQDINENFVEAIILIDNISFE